MIRRVIFWKDSIEANSTPSGQDVHPAQRLLLDDRFVGAHPLAVERRQQHPPLAQVALFVHREERAVAEDFAERVLARVEDVGLRRVDRFDQVGTGDEDHLAEARHQHRQRVAVALLQVADQRVPRDQEGDPVEQLRGLRAGGKAIASRWSWRRWYSQVPPLRNTHRESRSYDRLRNLVRWGGDEVEPPHGAAFLVRDGRTGRRRGLPLERLRRPQPPAPRRRRGLPPRRRADRLGVVPVRRDDDRRQRGLRLRTQGRDHRDLGAGGDPATAPAGRRCRRDLRPRRGRPDRSARDRLGHRSRGLPPGRDHLQRGLPARRGGARPRTSSCRPSPRPGR